MILAIDVGNTYTALGCIAGEGAGRVAPVLRVQTDRAATEFEYAIRFRDVLGLGGVDVHAIEGAVLASVVPSVTARVREACAIVTGADPLVVGAGIRTGLPILTDDPGDVGADMIAAAVGAASESPLPCIIIDMSTATTVTVVDGAGRFIGGSIMPGVAISLEALTSSTSLLPSIDLLPPKKVIASNTTDSMKAGILFGAAGAIDGTIDRFTEALGAEPGSIVTTGGIGALVCPFCRHSIKNDPELLLKGLGIIWRKNQR